ncbi:MAG: hypothetical protein KDA45_04775 [Planctomycetales bacterium]|nr:hypothetical protein [Planctomycetales bacterium]
MRLPKPLPLLGWCGCWTLCWTLCAASQLPPAETPPRRESPPTETPAAESPLAEFPLTEFPPGERQPAPARLLPARWQRLTELPQLREALRRPPPPRPVQAPPDGQRLRAVRVAPRAAGEPQVVVWGLGNLQASLSVRTAASVPHFVLAYRRVEGQQPARPADFVLPPAIGGYYHEQRRQELQRLRQFCQLTPQEEAKLGWAAQGELSRVARQAASWHQRFDGISIDDMREIRAAAEELTALNRLLRQGLRGEDSLFYKVLKKILSVEEMQALAAEQLQIYLLQRSRARDTTLSEDQREQLLGLLLGEYSKLADPPLFLSPNYIVQLLGMLPRNKLQEFLDEQQLASLQVVLPRAEVGVELEFR